MTSCRASISRMKVIPHRCCRLLKWSIIVGIMTFMVLYERHDKISKSIVLNLSIRKSKGVSVSLLTSTIEPPQWQRVLCELSKIPFHNKPPSATSIPVVDGELVIQPSKDNIFLVESACNPRPLYRAWCTVESWAYMHPDSRVWYVLTAPYIDDSTGLVKEILKTYTNLEIGVLDLNKLFSKTPLSEFFTTWKWKNDTDWPVIQLSDMVRVALLWKFGGLYSDTDGICINNTSALSNVIGFQESTIITNGLYHCLPNHNFLYEIMKEMVFTYSPKQWSSLGPLAYTSVLQKFCKENATFKRGKELQTCLNMTLLPPESFYPVHYSSRRKLFKNDGGKDCEKDFKNSYAIHFFNKLTVDKAVKVCGDSIYDVTAKKFCPVTYKHLSFHSQFF